MYSESCSIEIDSRVRGVKRAINEIADDLGISVSIDTDTYCDGGWIFKTYTTEYNIRLTGCYPEEFSGKIVFFDEELLDIDSDTDNIYQIKFIKHWSGSITCLMINGWCDFQVDFGKYGYKIHDIVKEFNDKVKEHKKCWSLLSSRGCKIHNYKFQEEIYSVYVLTGKYC